MAVETIEEKLRQEKELLILIQQTDDLLNLKRFELSELQKVIIQDIKDAA